MDSMKFSVVHTEVRSTDLYILIRYREGDADSFTLPIRNGTVIVTSDNEHKLYDEAYVWSMETGAGIVFPSMHDVRLLLT